MSSYGNLTFHTFDGFMRPFQYAKGISMKNNGKELLKDYALWTMVFGALFLLVFYNYIEVKGILNHKFN